MLKPITEQEKATFTLKVQLEKAVFELLTEAYEAGYTGLIDICPNIHEHKGKLVMEVRAKKVPASSTKLTEENVLRFHVVQGKGFKRIK